MVSQPASRIDHLRRKVRDGLLSGVGVAAFVICLALLNTFASTRLRLTDIYFVNQEVSERVVIIALDDASLNAYGRSPTQWPRRLYADLIAYLSAAEARVIAFDILFAERTDDDALVAEAIQAARTSETRTRLIMPVAGIDDVLRTPSGTSQVAFTNVLRPVDVIANAADYIAYVNAFPDIDGTIRRQASLIKTMDEQGISFSIATVLAYLRIPASAAQQVITTEDNTRFITREHPLPIDAHGLWRQNFFGKPHTAFPIVSLVDVLEDNVEASTFNDKIVLIGLIDSVGAIDLYPVPTASEGQMMAGVEIHAHAIETILHNNAISEMSMPLRIGIITVITILSATLYSLVRWYFKIIIALGLLFMGFITASVFFQVTYIIVDLLDGILIVGLPLMLSIGLDITREITRRQESEFLLNSVVALSAQHLEIDKIFVAIAEDIRRILPVTSGRIYLLHTREEQQYNFPQGKVSNAHLQTLYDVVTTTHKPFRNEQYAAFPLIWYQELIGVFAVHAEKRINNKQYNLLDDLARQLAPGIENARLYIETEQQKYLTEAILYGSPAIHIILDSDLQVINSNDTFHTELETHLTPHIGSQNFIDILSDLGVEDSEVVTEWFASPHVFQREIEIMDKTYTLNASYLFGIDYWVLTLSDITPIAELSALKTRMIRMASHDLKNPISTVLGYTILLAAKSNNLTEKQLHYIKSIELAGNNMLQIVTDILNLENLRSAHIDPEPINITTILRQLAVRHEPAFALNSQTFTSVLPDEAITVMGQPGQLSQAFTNLLDNASKYTPENGHITLRLSTIANTVRVEVEDTGYGVPEEAQAKLFEEFYRVRTAATTHIAGTGLGLSMVKSIIDAHNGHIRVESEEGKGSTFFIQLPLVQIVDD